MVNYTCKTKVSQFIGGSRHMTVIASINTHDQLRTGGNR